MGNNSVPAPPRAAATNPLAKPNIMTYTPPVDPTPPVILPVGGVRAGQKRQDTKIFDMAKEGEVWTKKDETKLRGLPKPVQDAIRPNLGRVGKGDFVTGQPNDLTQNRDGVAVDNTIKPEEGFAGREDKLRLWEVERFLNRKKSI